MMLRSISRVVTAILITVVCCCAAATGFAQTRDADDPQSRSADRYYSRPDLKAVRSNVNRAASSLSGGEDEKTILERYEELLAQNGAADSHQTGRRAIPDRLVPPGNSAIGFRAGDRNGPLAQAHPVDTSVAAATPVAATAAAPVNAIPQNLPPIVQPHQVTGATAAPIASHDVRHANAQQLEQRSVAVATPSQSFGNQLHQSARPPEARYPIVPVVRASPQIAGQAASIPSGYVPAQSEVTRATILTVQQGDDQTSGPDPFGQIPPRGTDRRSGPRQDDPFADPPENGDQQPQNPFADPPPDMDPNQDNNPFADPPTDPDTDRDQDPVELPGEKPPVDPFPATPQDITPPGRFIVPPESAPTQTDSPEQSNVPETDPGTTEPEDPAPRRDPTLGSGPFKSRGFQPKSLLPAPPTRDYQQPAPQYAPMTPQQMYPDSHYGPAGDPYLNQPTLVDDHSAFEKRELYEGITQQFDDQNFAAYECAPCSYDSRPPGMQLAERFRQAVCGRCGLAMGGRSGVGRCGCPIDCQPPAYGQCEDCNGAFAGGGFAGDCYQGQLDQDQFVENDCCGSSGMCCGDSWGIGDCGSCFDPLASCGCEPMFYISLFGGYTQLQESDERIPGLVPFPGPATQRQQFDDGYGLGVAIGQFQGRNLRTELEFSFRDNGVDSVLRPQLGTPPSLVIPYDGSVKAYSGMMNFVWDFNRWTGCGVYRPYLGAGAGFSFVDFERTQSGSNNTFVSSDSAFAWQLFAGVSRPVGQTLDGFVEYRYFRTDSLKLNSVSGGELDYHTNNIFFGLRKHF